MNKKDSRFEVIYSQGVADVIRVIQDNMTGVQYLQVYTGGLTPLLDKDGKPVTWEIQGTGGAEH